MSGKNPYEDLKTQDLPVEQKLNKAFSIPSFFKDIKVSNARALDFLMDDKILGHIIEKILGGENGKIDDKKFGGCLEILLNHKILIYVVNSEELLKLMFSFTFSKKKNPKQISSWIKLVQEYLYEQPMKLYNYLSDEFSLIESLILQNMSYSGFEELILKLMFCEYGNREEETFGFQKNLNMKLVNFPKSQKYRICYTFESHDMIEKYYEKLKFFIGKDDNAGEQIVYIFCEIILRSISVSDEEPHPLCESLLCEKNLKLFLELDISDGNILQLFKVLIRGMLKYKQDSMLTYVLQKKLVELVGLIKTPHPSGKKRIGEVKLCIVEFLSDVMSSFSHPEIDRIFVETQFLELVTELFFEHDSNNFLHFFYSRIMRHLLQLNDEPPKKSEEEEKEKNTDTSGKCEYSSGRLFKEVIFTKCKMIQRILDHTEKNRKLEEEFGNGRRLCNMGHVIQLSNFVNLDVNKKYRGMKLSKTEENDQGKEEEESSDEEIEGLKEKWSFYTLHELKKENERQNRLLGGQHPLKMMSGGGDTGDDSDSDSDSDSTSSSSSDSDTDSDDDGTLVTSKNNDKSDSDDDSDDEFNLNDSDSDDDDEDGTLVKKTPEAEEDDEKIEKKEKEETKSDLKASVKKLYISTKRTIKDDSDSDDEDSPSPIVPRRHKRDLFNSRTKKNGGGGGTQPKPFYDDDSSDEDEDYVTKDKLKLDEEKNLTEEKDERSPPKKEDLDLSNENISPQKKESSSSSSSSDSDEEDPETNPTEKEKEDDFVIVDETKSSSPTKAEKKKHLEEEDAIDLKNLIKNAKLEKEERSEKEEESFPDLVSPRSVRAQALMNAEEREIELLELRDENKELKENLEKKEEEILNLKEDKLKLEEDLFKSEEKCILLEEELRKYKKAAEESEAGVKVQSGDNIRIEDELDLNIDGENSIQSEGVDFEADGEVKVSEEK